MEFRSRLEQRQLLPVFWPQALPLLSFNLVTEMLIEDMRRLLVDLQQFENNPVKEQSGNLLCALC